MAQAVEEWYKQMPIITRSYLTAAVLTTVGCSLEIISPYNLYLNPKRVVQQWEIWRLITNFLYFRRMDLDFLFHMFFLARYCKLLEENSFRGRTADFFYMLLFGATTLTGIVVVGGMIPFVSEKFASIVFLSNSLTFMMVYVWSKHNPLIHMSFLGLFTFTAAYLPWVLLGFSILLGTSTWVDVLGMIAGHSYYYLEDVYPRMSGRRPLKTPAFIKSLFADENVVVTRQANARFAPPPPQDLHNNNILHVADGTSFEDFTSADCAMGAGVVSNNGVAAIDNDTLLEGKDCSNVKATTITVEDMGMDVVNVDNLDSPRDGLGNQGKENCGGALVSTQDSFMVEFGQDFPADPSTVIGSVEASVSIMALTGGGPVASDYQAMNESEAGKVMAEYETAVAEEMSISEFPGGEKPNIDSFLVPHTESECVPSVVGENSGVNREGGLDVESNPMECAATRESSDFCSAIDDIDTDFLNVDDDVDEYDEAANNDEPNAEEAQSLENSGWSSRTRGVARYLKNMFDEESGRMRKSVAIDHLLAGKTRKEASRMFFETLVLKTKDYVHVEQEIPFDCINIKPRIKLLKSEF